MNSLIGIWIFSSLIYNGEVRPLPNENLKLYYIFSSATQNEIYYYRTNESGHCRRFAEYSNNDQYIEQKITEIDADNAAECSLDSDMQPGAYSKVPYSFQNGQLQLNVSMGDDQLIYVFSRSDLDQNPVQEGVVKSR